MSARARGYRAHTRTRGRKAFEQITKTLLPASHKALARALDAEARSYRNLVDAFERRGAKRPAVAAVPASTHDVDEDGDDAGD